MADEEKSNEEQSPEAAAEEAPSQAPEKDEPSAKKQAPAKKKAAADEAAIDSGDGEEEGEKAESTEAEVLLGEDGEPLPKVKKIKGAKNIRVGVVHIKATFNNTIVSVCDLQGNVISWSTAGRAGFKGSRKSTAYAASVVAQDAARAAMSHGVQECEVRVQGPGAGRESAVRAIQSAGITVSTIRDVTPVPHNGCRPKKRRRV